MITYFVFDYKCDYQVTLNVKIDTNKKYTNYNTLRAATNNRFHDQLIWQLIRFIQEFV